MKNKILLQPSVDFGFLLAPDLPACLMLAMAFTAAAC